jgi:formate dehydrogenase gamma subunit
MERSGKEIPLFVDETHYSASVHADLQCVDCHSGFNAEDLPHKEGENIAKVDCASCHDTDVFSNSVHAKNKLDCFQCHTKHDIKEADILKKDLTNLCVSCHTSSDVKSYKQSAHFTALSHGKKGPSCISCHNQSAHNIQAASFSKAQEEKVCSTCHASSKNEFSKSIHAIAKGDDTPGCVDCHGSHSIYNNKYSISSQSCLKCHLDQSKFTGEKAELVSFVRNYQTSIHGRIGPNKKEAATCIDCHGDHMVMGVEATNSLTSRGNISETCGKCHKDEVKHFQKSSHGIAFLMGSKLAPTCTDCHGEHTIETIDKSPLSKVNEHKVCFKCHVENPEVLKLTSVKADQLLKYTESAHYLALQKGNDKAAACSDCHTGHSMLPALDKNSTVNKNNVPETCGKCHGNETAEFNQSIHAGAIKSGNLDAPSCITCHGDHQIMAKSSPKSSVSRGKQVSMLCSNCHGSVELSEKYGLPTGKVESYYESYHGLAVRGGSKFAADCASCHGAHKILPSSDPASTINRDNLSKTCGKCHPGANLSDQFRTVHVTASENESLILYWISQGYVWLIVLIIGGMLLHNLLDLYRKLVDRKKHKHEIEEAKKHGKVYLRMSRSERIQHFIMLTSFLSLVISGFGLKYPDAFWVNWIRAVMGENAFELRGLAHRIFGIAMILVSLYHAYYLGFNKRGRQLFMDFLPKYQDLPDLIANIKYILGISKEKPYFGRFSYIEKAEYWALIWGVIVMSATGLILMFNNFFLANTPKILMDISTLVHFYEAWLATLAIFVWHFYFVIFNPEVYPLNTAFINGVLTEEEMMNEHPRELEEIKKKELK